MHVSWDDTSYTFPHEIVPDYDPRLSRLEARAQANNHPFYDGPCARLLQIRWTPIDGSEQKHVYMRLGPIGWYDYSVIFDFVSECRVAETTDAFAGLGNLADVEK